MSLLVKATVIPFMFFLVIYSLTIHQPVSRLAQPMESLPPVLTHARENAKPTPDPSVTSSLAAQAPTLRLNLKKAEFITLTIGELTSFSQEQLFEYMLDYRQAFLLNTDFMEMEYNLFQAILNIEPFAALDYIIATGQDASSEFFYSFLFSDFMVHDGKSDAVVEYINQFGPQVDLLHLISFAGLTNEIAPHIRREILTEYILGNAEYHAIISSAQWDLELSEDERINAFLNTEPNYLEDPYDLINDIVSLNNPATYEHLKQYIEVHPDRYRLYHVVKTITELNLESTIHNMMSQRHTYNNNDQVQIALIALDFGHHTALEYLIERIHEPIITSRPLNVSYVLLNHIAAPPYIDKSMNWVMEEASSLRFNQFTKMFEL